MLGEEKKAAFLLSHVHNCIRTTITYNEVIGSFYMTITCRKKSSWSWIIVHTFNNIDTLFIIVSPNDRIDIEYENMMKE